jgi:putative FmdB family regulatory protein
MPTYEYACQSCGRHVEVFQKFSEDSLTTCEVCGGPLRKVFHPAGILFKGSGFYATDSRRSGRGQSGDEKGEKKGEKGEKKGEKSEKKDTGSKPPESSGSSGFDSSSGSSSKGGSSSDASSKGDSSRGDSSKGDSSRSTEKSA